MGPTVAIWLPRERSALTAEDLLAIARLLDASATSSLEVNIRSTAPIDGSTESPDGQQFGFNIGDPGFDDRQLEQVATAFGFMPSSAIHVFAYVNSPADHRMLAELACFFARQFDGIVDFGGNLGPVTVRSGKLVAISYLDSHGWTPAAFHVSDAKFLEEWLRDRDFHMIK